MIADFFTKLSQGKTFKKLLCHIMNIEEDDPALAPAQDHRSVLGIKSKRKSWFVGNYQQIGFVGNYHQIEMVIKVPRVKRIEVRTTIKRTW